MTAHERPCWIVREPDEPLWLADRTQRALRERGIAARVATSHELAEQLDTTHPAWLLRAGALPDRLPALPPPAPGRAATTYLGVELDDDSRLAPGWQALVDAHGGHVAAGAVLPRWVVACVESPASLADALRRGETLQRALAAGRSVVATGIRARWSADVRVALLIGMLHRGGAERVVLDLAAHLPAQGVATRVFTCFPPKRDTLAAPAGTVHLHEPAAGSGDLAARADRAMCRWGADIVHAHLMDGRVLRQLTSLGHGVATTAHNARAGYRPDPLTDRETEILRLMAGGYSNKEIANSLGVAEGTVKNHVSNILSKLGVRDRTRAVLKAFELGIV